MPKLDFDPEEPLIFPPLVEIEMSSEEFMTSIQNTPVPPGQTALWFLGQNSWILKSDQGRLVATDPYLTDFCASQRTRVPTPKSRLLPVFIEPEDLQVDVVLITHSHCDHCDPFTLERLSIKETAKFLAPFQAVEVLKGAGIGASRIHLMHPLQTWKDLGMEVIGCFAEPTDHTDLNHMGFTLRFEGGKLYYNSGDTAKTELLGHVAAWKPEVMSICINGGYHNLSHWEAAEIAALIKPRVAIPAHYDMFPHNLQPPHMFRKSLFQLARDVDYHRMKYYEPYFF